MTTVSTLLASAGLLAACGKGPTEPGAIRPESSATRPPEVSVTRLDIAGPDAVPPGGTAQFTAVASFSDGSTRDVTNEAEWRGSIYVGATQLSIISTTGLMTAPSQRTAVHVAVSYRGRDILKEVLVLPEGTYAILGDITAGGVGLPSAWVEVVGDPVSRVFSGDGYYDQCTCYNLFGVPSGAQIRVTKDGYQPLVQTVQITQHWQRIDFELIPVPLK